MKRIIIILFILTLQMNTVLAVNTDLSNIENSIYGYDYRNENEIKRVERIEKTLYSAKKTGKIETRIKEIKDDIGYTKPIIKDATQDKIALEKAPKEDASVEYPIVDKLEKELFKQTYKDENIYKRLDRLELKVYNKKTTDSLTDRVDKLASLVLPKQINKDEFDDEKYQANNIDSYYQNNGFDNIDNKNLPFQIAVLEQELLNNNFEQDNISNRLNRLEQRLFNRTFSNDTDITRMQRIIVANNAKQNSARYESNRRMQNVATASQLGGILLMILAMLL